MRHLPIVFAFLAVSPSAVAEQPGNPGNLAPDTRFQAPGKPTPHNANYTDRLFARLVANGGDAEVAFGKLATRSANADVKAFAQRMVQDHLAANDQLRRIADTIDAPLPQELDKDHRNQLAHLEKLQGAAFDATYMSGQITDHQKTAQLLEWEIGSGEDVAMKDFASKTLPIVMDHLEMARHFKAKLTAVDLTAGSGARVKETEAPREGQR
jgi:putative membrane protein